MLTRYLLRTLILLGIAAGPAFGQAPGNLEADPSLRKYLVDVAPSPVTAGGWLACPNQPSPRSRPPRISAFC